MMTPQVTIKMTLEARRLLRLIAAQTGEKHYQVLERLLRGDWRSLQEQAHRQTPPHRPPNEAMASLRQLVGKYFDGVDPLADRDDD
jgi:hypothetical protein